MWRRVWLTGFLFFCMSPIPHASETCTRVQPGIGFPQTAWLAEQELQSATRLDLDGDGELEIVAMRKIAYPAGFDIVRVFADGVGALAGEVLASFPAPDPWWDFSPSAQVATGDLDGDGLNDLVVLWQGFFISSRLQARLGLAEGGYGGLEQHAGIGFFADLAGLGDFDGDGREEVLASWRNPWTANRRFDRIVRDPVRGLETESTLVVSKVGLPQIGDLNGDGLDDIVFIEESWVPLRLWASYGSEVSPLSNAEALSFSFPPWRPQGVLFLPASSGADELLIFEKQRSSPLGLAITRHRISETSTRLERMSRQDLEPGLEAADALIDVDHDGRLDLVRGTRFGRSLQILLAAPGGVFSKAYENRRMHDFVATIDLDHDGYYDALSVRDGALELQWGQAGFRFESGEIVRPVPLVDARDSSRELISGDVDEDGVDDLIIRRHYGDDLNYHVLFGQGDGSFREGVEVPRVDRYAGTRLADLDGDGHLDLVALSAVWGGGGLVVAYGDGDGSFEAWRFELDGLRCRSFHRADLDADGLPEVLVAAIADSNHTTLSAYGVVSRVMVPRGSMTIASNSYQIPLAAGEIDGVAGDEIVYEIHTPFPDRRYALRWRSWSSSGGFSEERVLRDDLFSQRAYALDLEDLDGDGVLDLLTRRMSPYWIQETSVSVYRGLGHASFSPLWSGDEPRRAEFSRLLDLDGDGFLDLVGRGTPISVSRGDGTGRFRESEAAWFGVDRNGAIGMFRAAGVLDLVDIEYAEGDALSPHSSVVVPQTGVPLPSDQEAPEVHFVLEALGNDLWVVASSAEDDCSWARIVSRQVAVLDVPTVAPIYLPGTEVEIIILEDPATGLRKLVLRGPNASQMRELWARIAALRGVAIPQNYEMTLIETATWGPSADELPGVHAVGNNLRIVQRLLFDGSSPVRVELHHPREQLTLRAVAEDRAGKRAHAVTGLRGAASTCY